MNQPGFKNTPYVEFLGQYRQNVQREIFSFSVNMNGMMMLHHHLLSGFFWNLYTEALGNTMHMWLQVSPALTLESLTDS